MLICVKSFTDVFLIDATNAETIAVSLKDIAFAKGAGNSKDDALHWLSWYQSEWLLLLDNADDPAVNLHDCFPHCPHGNILITSRNRDARRYAPLSNYEVYGMDAKDAKDLLLNVVGISSTYDAEEYPSIIVKVCYQWTSNG
jgi:hypothetical protein